MQDSNALSERLDVAVKEHAAAEAEHARLREAQKSVVHEIIGLRK
jgi:hypothetical protein